MSADDDLDALEAELEGYDDGEDDEDASPLKRAFKKYKLIIIPVAVLLPVLVVLAVFMGGEDTIDNRKVMIVPELAPEPGKQIKMAPEQPGGEGVPDREKGVFNVVAEGGNDAQVKITAPPEEPQTPPAEGMAADGGKEPIAMVPEGAEKTPKDGGMMPPPQPPAKDGEIALPALPAPGEPAKPGADGGKMAENILPAEPATPAAKQPEPTQPEGKQMAEAPPAQPTQPEKPAANNNQITVTIPTAPNNQTVAMIPPPPPPTGSESPTTPMRTMAGVYRIQVASARSEAAAQSLWSKQVSRHPDVLGQLPLTVQPAVVQDRGTFYRVQGGAFSDREAADSVCRKLKSRGQDCLVVRP